MVTGHGRPGTTSRPEPKSRRDLDSDDCCSNSSLESGSTDVEFLRRRAEAKLQELERKMVGGSSGRRTRRGQVGESSSGGSSSDATLPRTRHLDQMGSRLSSARSGSSIRTDDRSLRHRIRKGGRPPTNQSEGSMLGESRWSIRHA
ncbi:unnamed protein product [Choristocarpus tenellus]